MFLKDDTPNYRKNFIGFIYIKINYNPQYKNQYVVLRY
jgi:hypothetical protein